MLREVREIVTETAAAMLLVCALIFVMAIAIGVIQ